MIHSWPALVGVVAVVVVTMAIGSWGLRFSRTTSDFMVASRTVGPAMNAAAVSGEYLSAASFLGVAGLVVVFGAEMLWYPVGWTAGYLVLLVLVAAPLRRSGAYTLPDFAEVRLDSRRARFYCSLLVVAVGWLYLLPQFHGAGLILHSAVGAPAWVGTTVVAVVVVLGVAGGGMRAITFVQAFQYWLKLTALLVPVMVLLVVWVRDGATNPADLDPVGGIATGAAEWSQPLGAGPKGLYATYSLIVATFLGTMGLPHVVVRFYTNPDGRAARRTTLVILWLLAAFYLLPPLYGGLGRVYADRLSDPTQSDVMMLELPQVMLPGWGGEVLTALLAAGAFAAFLSTTSGLTIAVAGVLGQDVTRRIGRWRLSGIAAFRVGAVLAVIAPALVALLGVRVSVATLVGLAFAVAASTFCPLLVLGIWWRGLTADGAVAGLLVGGVGSGAAVLWTLTMPESDSWGAVLLGSPAAWSVPAAFVTMVLVSRTGRPPRTALRSLVRLHTPEAVRLDRE